MMSLSMQLNELHTHRHSGGHFQPINSESAQSRIENNLLHPERNAALSELEQITCPIIYLLVIM